MLGREGWWVGVGEGLVRLRGCRGFRAFRECSWRIRGFGLGFDSPGCVQRLIKWSVGNADGRICGFREGQSTNGWFLPPIPRSRLGEKELCWYVRGMCMKRGCLSYEGKGLKHTFLNITLLTSFQN